MMSKGTSNTEIALKRQRECETELRIFYNLGAVTMIVIFYGIYVCTFVLAVAWKTEFAWNM